MNIKPEQMWSRFRRVWTGGFEDLLDEGIRQQWYNTVNIADRYVYQCPRDLQNL